MFFLAANTFPVCPQDVGWTKSVTSEVRETNVMPGVKLNDHSKASGSFRKLFGHRNF
jgi:hypothetical protein